MRAENPSNENAEGKAESQERIDNLESELKTCKEVNEQTNAELAKTKEMLTIMPFKTRVSIKKLSLVFTVSMDFTR